MCMCACAMCRHLIVLTDALLCVRAERVAPRAPGEAPMPRGAPMVPALARPAAAAAPSAAPSAPAGPLFALEPDWFCLLSDVRAPAHLSLP
jgi:hypothetical protein